MKSKVVIKKTEKNIYSAFANVDEIEFEGFGRTKKEAYENFLKDVQSVEKGLCKALYKIRKLETNTYKKYEEEKYNQLGFKNGKP